MPPHNLTEVINGCIAMIENPEIGIPELMTHIKAPDFPNGRCHLWCGGRTGCLRDGQGPCCDAGQGAFRRDPHRKGEIIIVEEIPYQVNKADMVRKAADLVNEKRIEGISEIRDESDRNGMRVVFELKRDAIPNVVLNKLYKYTQLQTSFSVNNIALVKGRPDC